jgi:hypothetical protein
MFQQDFPESFELSVNQKEFWDRCEIPGRFYHQFVVVIIGELDEPALLRAIAVVVKRHHVLTSICAVQSDSQYPAQVSWPSAIDLNGSEQELGRKYDPFLFEENGRERTPAYRPVVRALG